ncbi:MAG: acetolactate synthase small subunit [Proteobacteria bacterium]|nr:acetolactate synthase small subunit [Pseudomonadota bacterium]
MTTMNHKKRRAITVFVHDKPGVLNKISMLIRHKMYNVETLTVSATVQRGYSRITLTLYEDDDRKTRQVISQIEKMTEVISARELDAAQSFWREVALIKFEANHKEFDSLVDKYGFEVLDKQDEGVYIVQLASISKNIDDLLSDLGGDKVIDVARSGFTALER